MAKIIVRRRAAKNTSIGGHTDSGLQSFTVDLTKSVRQKSGAYGFFLIAFFFLTLLASSAVALIVISQQVTGLFKIATTALPQAATVPLADKNMIAALPSVDFKTKGTAVLTADDIIPALKKLPLYETPPKNAAPPTYISSLKNNANSAREGDAALAAGNKNLAIKKYTHALADDAGDDTSRHNLVALLLDDAAAFDQAGARAKALTAYQSALSYWRGDAGITRAIEERIAFLQEQ